jgi:hypothetical protein
MVRSVQEADDVCMNTHRKNAIWTPGTDAHEYVVAGRNLGRTGQLVTSRGRVISKGILYSAATRLYPEYAITARPVAA